MKLPGIDINTNNSSPRELIVHNNKAYFTNYYSQDVKVLNLETYYIEESIKVKVEGDKKKEEVTVKVGKESAPKKIIGKKKRRNL